MYKAKDGLGLTNDWIALNVCPNITRSFDRKVGAIMGKALLWAVYEPSCQQMIPRDRSRRITRKIADLDLDLEEGENPIHKYEIIASESDGTISLDEIPPDDQQIGIRARDADWKVAMYAKVTNTSQRVTAMQQHGVAELSEIKRKLRLMEGILRSLSVAPARIIPGGRGGRQQQPMLIQGDAVNTGDRRPAILHKCPRTLDLLWTEYINGIAGNKPAQEFTREERGRNKSRYCRRLPFWKCMQRLTTKGYTVNISLDRIKQVYGDVSVTKILEALRRDEKHGGHHRLR